MGSPLGIYTTRTVITYTCSLFTVDTDIYVPDSSPENIRKKP